MDYGRLSRRELQVLCKEHGIPANKTNVFMAEQLAAILNGPSDGQKHAEESGPDPAEVVKSKAKGVNSAEADDALAANEVEDLSAHFAQSTVVDEKDGEKAAIVEDADAPRRNRTQTTKKSATSNGNQAAVAASDDVLMSEKSEPFAVMPTATISPSKEILLAPPVKQNVAGADAELIPVEEATNEPEPAPKKTRAKGKKSTKAKASVLEEPPAQEIQELNALEPAVEDLTVVLPLAPEDMDSRTSPELQDEEAAVTVKPAVKKTKARGKKSEKLKPSPDETQFLEDISPAPVAAEKTSSPNGENLLAPSSVTELTANGPLPLEGDCMEEDLREKPVAKKPSKVKKAKKSSKVKSTTAASDAVIHDDQQNPLVNGDSNLIAPASDGEGLVRTEDSPAFGLALNIGIPREPLSAASFGSSNGDDSFEFQPVPSSLTEILSPRAPADFCCLATDGCQFRAGRKTGKACTSCASERKVVSSVVQLNQPSIGIAEAHFQEDKAAAEEVSFPGQLRTETVLVTAPKQSDDKENSIKNVDLSKMSVRKLKKEAQKRGLAGRTTNVHAAKV